ncbi:MAG: RnfABCDGE type electron transport complex subunit B [Candidatus Schmidhempelia sp.]|nr:RnfABCDGE type electron transport complex subunit B [Candidatus Schmidhempelia sp.]
MSNLVLKAFIDEYNCIGCSKCIRVCPTDAIVGAKKVLHTVLPQLCTSCGDCMTACPTNCITFATSGEALPLAEEIRLSERKTLRQQRGHVVNKVVDIFTPPPPPTKAVISLDERKRSVAEAIARARARKQTQQPKE